MKNLSLIVFLMLMVFVGSVHGDLVIDAPMENTADDQAAPAASWAADPSGTPAFNDAATWPTWVYAGDYALEVLPSSSLPGINYTQTMNTGEFTIALWLGQEDVGDGGDITVFDYKVQFCEDNGGKLQIWINFDVQGWVYIESSAFLGDADFDHIAATYDGDDLRLYVNGEEVASQEDLNESAPTTSNVKVGVYGWHGPLNGAYDEVKIYDNGLTPAEVAALYISYLSGPPIDVQPDSQDFDYEENATFYVGVTNPITGDETGLTYKWYKYVEGGSDTLEDTNTDDGNFVITSVDISDVGSYYCVAELTSDPNFASTSDSAALSLNYSTPADMAGGVSPDVTLSWLDCYPDTLTYDVYFGTDYDAVEAADNEDDEFIRNQEGLTYDPTGSLEKDTYYWRIDIKTASETITGNVLRFKVGGDEIILGNYYSESVAHTVTCVDSTTGTDGLGESYRSFAVDGTITFTMAVDPDTQNYLTAKLWGSDTATSSDKYLSLYYNNEELSNASSWSDLRPLDKCTPDNPFADRFVYSTYILPLSITSGQTSVTLKIEATVEASRGLYCLYTHTDPYLCPRGY